MSDEWTPVEDSSVRVIGHDDGVPVLAIAAGLVAAVVGGALWALIAIYGSLEVGWVAWGIGLLVGGAMSLTTPARSRKLAVTAAVLALLGLAAGKAMTFAGSTGKVADEILRNEEYLQGMTAWRMYSVGELSPEVQKAVSEIESGGDTLTDALWARMLVEAEARLLAMPEADKEALARETAGRMIQNTGLVAGVKAQVSGFDILWIVLALATAFRIMDAAPPALVVETGPVEREKEAV